jgi:hypothetical protein
MMSMVTLIGKLWPESGLLTGKRTAGTRMTKDIFSKTHITASQKCGVCMLYFFCSSKYFKLKIKTSNNE